MTGTSHGVKLYISDHTGTFSSLICVTKETDHRQLHHTVWNFTSLLTHAHFFLAVCHQGNLTSLITQAHFLRLSVTKETGQWQLHHMVWNFTPLITQAHFSPGLHVLNGNRSVRMTSHNVKLHSSDHTGTLFLSGCVTYQLEIGR